MFNIIDLGHSKIRFSIFDKNKDIIFSENLSVIFDNQYSNHFYIIEGLIKKAEKEISSYIEDAILIFDTSEQYSIDISLNKESNNNLTIENLYNLLVLELYQIINSNYNNYEIVHIIVNECVIDKKKYNNLPDKLLKTNNLKVHFKLICFPKNILNKLKENFKKINLNIIKVFSTSYIKSLSYLEKINSEKVSFLEIGWKRTSLLIFNNKKLQSINSILLGGFHISNDISKVFKISIDEAEKLKKLFNKSENEFSYKNSNLESNQISTKEIFNKNISVNLLKEVILYRVQEIIDLIFLKFKKNLGYSKIKDNNLILIGGGTKLLNNNVFHLDDKFDHKKINFFEENDVEICSSGLTYYLNNYDEPVKKNKNEGIFEKFFNIFNK